MAGHVVRIDAAVLQSPPRHPQRNTLLGITGIDPAVRESAVAMGMTRRQILWQVELPLAVPSIVAGLRLATVATIGTATIAAAIGGGGLGVFIFRGVASVDTV